MATPVAASATTVGFIGLGVMGSAMAGHLLAAGYPLVVHNRTRAKAEALLARGARWAGTVGELAAACDLVLTIVGYPADVEQVYLGADGLVARARPGAYLVDMTTSRPDLAQRIAAAGAARGISCLDAPVSGGDLGAREARLAIMVGGDEAALAHVLPALRTLGANIVRQGPAGAGQHTKLANQIAIAANMIGVCEALGYAVRAGLDPERVLQSISGGAAGSWSLSNLAPRMLAGRFEPGFFVKHLIKDLAIAVESADALGLDTPGVDLALSLYRRLAALGGADDGTQALFRLYR